MDQREMLRRAFPSYGPDWDAAIDYGIDVSLLETNLALTVAQRLEQLDEMSRLYALLTPYDKKENDRAGSGSTYP